MPCYNKGYDISFKGFKFFLSIRIIPSLYKNNPNFYSSKSIILTGKLFFDLILKRFFNTDSYPTLMNI